MNIFVFLVCQLLACSQTPTPKAKPTPVTKGKTTMPTKEPPKLAEFKVDLTTPNVGLDVDNKYAAVTTVHGVLDIDRVAGGKRFQGTWLVKADSTRLVLSYRPVKAYFPYVGKKVMVKGRPYTPGADTQHIMADHFEVQEITLANGEQATPLAIDRLPSPPTIRRQKDLLAQLHQWVDVRATVKEFVAGTKSAVLTLEDQSTLLIKWAPQRQWKGLLGKQVSVIARLTPSSDDQPYQLSGHHSVCQGDVARCGMDKGMGTKGNLKK